MSFHDPLPLGMESEEESFYITLKRSVDLNELTSSLNRELPPGLFVDGCRRIFPDMRLRDKGTISYRIIAGETFEEAAIAAFSEASEWMVERTTKKGRIKKINLKDTVLSMIKTGPASLRMTLKTEQGPSVRPADVIQSVFHLPESTIRTAEIIKEK